MWLQVRGGGPLAGSTTFIDREDLDNFFVLLFCCLPAIRAVISSKVHAWLQPGVLQVVLYLLLCRLATAAAC